MPLEPWYPAAYARARTRRRLWYQVALDPTLFGEENLSSARAAYGARVPVVEAHRVV